MAQKLWMMAFFVVLPSLQSPEEVSRIADSPASLAAAQDPPETSIYCEVCGKMVRYGEYWSKHEPFTCSHCKKPAHKSDRRWCSKCYLSIGHNCDCTRYPPKETRNCAAWTCCASSCRNSAFSYCACGHYFCNDHGDWFHGKCKCHGSDVTISRRPSPAAGSVRGGSCAMSPIKEDAMLGLIFATCLAAGAPGGCGEARSSEHAAMCYYCGKVVAQQRCTCIECDRPYCWWDKNPWAPFRRCKDCSALGQYTCKTHGGTDRDFEATDSPGSSRDGSRSGDMQEVRSSAPRRASSEKRYLCSFCRKVPAVGNCSCSNCGRSFCIWDRNAWSLTRCHACSSLGSPACNTHR